MIRIYFCPARISRNGFIEIRRRSSETRRDEAPPLSFVSTSKRLPNDIASQVFPLGFSAFSSPRLSPPTRRRRRRRRVRSAATWSVSLPLAAARILPALPSHPFSSSDPLFHLPSVFPRRQAKNSPTLGQLTLIFHPRHPSRPPPSPPLPLPLPPLHPRAHAVTRSHAANTCSCLPLQSYGPEMTRDAFNDVAV